MADMFAATTTCSSSPPPNAPPPEQDDISRFLHQILLRSSSSSSSQAFAPHKTQSHSPPHIPPENQHQPVRLPVSDRISSGLGVFSPAGAYIPTVAPNVSSSSAGTIDNDPEEYDCESEEGFENLGEEMAAKPSSQRNPSKRSRAAEVHNLSEKGEQRRRSRINEKMKALQKLIPNSNKTDKASMLDEAIEYLKQLQLQVQMLTMRNGLSLYPMCPPGALQPNQIRMGFNDENGSLNMNMTGPISQNQGTTLANTLLNNLPIQCTNPNNPSQPSLSDFTNIISSETFRLGSSIPSQHGPFQFHKSSEDICAEGLLPHPQIDVDHNHRLNSSEFRMGAKASVTGRDRQESLQQMNSESGTILSTRLDG